MPKEPYQNESSQTIVSSFCMDYRNDVEIKEGSSKQIDKNLFTKHKQTQKKNKDRKTESMFLDSFERSLAPAKSTKVEKDDYQSYIESKKNELIYNIKPTVSEEEPVDKDKNKDLNIEKTYNKKYYKNDNINIAEINKKTHKVFAMFLILVLLVAVSLFVSRFKKEQIFINPYGYDQLIMPVVMQDVAPFNETSEIDKGAAVNCAVWYTLINEAENTYENYDSDGLKIIPFEDVAASLQRLFGSDYKIEPAEVKESELYKFDSENNNFHIPLSSNHDCFLPYTENVEVDKDNNVILSVLYIAPDDPYRCKEDGEAKEPNSTKRMKYTIKNDDNTKESYISSISEI